MKTKVLFLHKCFVKGGGIERVHQNLAFALSEQSVESSFFILDGFNKSEEGFTLLQRQHKAQRAPKKANLICKLNSLFESVKSQNITAIISATETANISAFICKLRFPHVQIVYTRHCAFDVSDQRLPPFAIKLLYSLYLLNGNVVAVSNSLQKQISASVIWGKKKIHFIPNAVVSDKILALSLHDEELEVEGQYFIAVGRLVEQKGFDLLLKAYCIAVNEDNSLPKLFIAGEGEEEQHLKELAIELGISKLVHFLGFVSNPYCIIKSASAFILSSRHEGMPTVLVEAMALGTPVIAFNCPTGPDELIIDAQNGSLVEHLNVNKLAESIIDFSSLPRSNLDKTVEHFSYSKVASSYAAIIGESV
ncbi:glycosyltransferase [Glaciecola sp. MF2-115]|uniref:glycosyltransferase n=1 Tax=Glaciecola sp. MF2-115 TaxID=3384827 RepID=UPI0039A0329D